MPKLSKLIAAHAAIRPVEIPCGEGEPPIVAQVDYTKVTGRIMQRLMHADAEPDQIGLVIEFLSKVILSWTATDEKGKIVPTTAEFFGDMAFPVLMVIVEAIGAGIGQGN